MRGFDFDPVAKTLTMHDTGRAALVIPDSIPVVLLPDEETIDDHDAVFPDLTKDRAYNHGWTMDVDFGGGGPGSINVSGSEYCRVGISVPAQEWSTTTNLMAAPDDTDIFVGLVKATRTVAPTHNWISSAIATLIPQDVWIPLPAGSLLLEAHLGFSRAMSLYVSGGNLVLHQQQSVSVAPGGYGTYGSGEGGSQGVGNPESGGEQVNVSGANGYPAHFVADASPHFKSRSFTDTGFGSYPRPQEMRKGGAQQCSLTDPTDYGATWRLDIRGRFGRRS